MAVLVLTLWGCSKEDKAKVPAEIKSYTMLVQRGAVATKHQIVPEFNSNGRLSKMTTESFRIEKGQTTMTKYDETTTTYAYDESAYTAVQTDVIEGELTFLGDQFVTILTFDGSWKLKTSYLDLLEATDSYEYDGDRMIRYTSKGISHETPFDITWKNGDIVSIVDESATITITYLPEENPFKSGIDPTLDNLMPDHYTYRMTGIHSAHLPATYTNSSKTVKTYTYEYKKDTEGRITEITISGEGETSYYVIGIQY